MTPWLIAGLVVCVDRLTKLFVQAALVPGQTVPLIPSVLHLTYVHNTGAAFGLFRGQGWWLVAVSLVICGWIVRQLRHPDAAPRAIRMSFALVLGGAIGTLVDRVWLGSVVDFIDLRVWPVFNVADACITIGVGWLLWQSLAKKHA